MIRVSTITQAWLGLCRKPPTIHALQSGIGIPTACSYEGQPGGSGGGTGAIRRGIGSAISGMRTLNRNRQLLWFSLLTGLVLAGNTICQGALCYLSWILSDGIIPLVLGFCIEFATVFCLVFLLAGIVMSIASEKGGSASFFTGMAGAKKYIQALFVWSFVLALAGMLLYRSLLSPAGFVWPVYSDLLGLLTQFPFTLNLNPSTFAEIPGYGGRSLLFWTYPYGFENALIFSGINLLLFILSAFVLPLIVLDNKTLREAVVGSVAMMKKTWVELVTCAIFLGVIVSGVFLTFLLVQAVHGMFTPIELIYDRPSGPLLALGFAYYLALFSIAFVMATVGGIAVLEIHQSSKTCPVPETPGPGLTS